MNNNSIGYDFQSTDEIVAFGKFNSVIPHWIYHLQIFISMRKRHWKNRKNRPCPDCGKMLTYSSKDSFDRAVGNNSVCKSCAQQDRTFTLETIEKMKQPKIC